MDHTKQLEHYFIRLSVSLCTNKPIEKWSYKKDTKEIIKDMNKTSMAIDMVDRDSALEKCFLTCYESLKRGEEEK